MELHNGSYCFEKIIEREKIMKKILTLSFVILALVIALSVNVSAGSSGVTLDSAVTYAPLGTTAMVYATDNTGMATYFVYTTNG